MYELLVVYKVMEQGMPVWKSELDMELLHSLASLGTNQNKQVMVLSDVTWHNLAKLCTALQGQIPRQSYLAP